MPEKRDLGRERDLGRVRAMRRSFPLGSLSALALPLFPGEGAAQEQTLLNVSYDPTRELYRDINTAFAAAWRTTARGEVRIRMSHGGSGRQTRSVIDGLEADVVTLALGQDVDVLAGGGGGARKWRGGAPGPAPALPPSVLVAGARGPPQGEKGGGGGVPERGGEGEGEEVGY